MLPEGMRNASIRKVRMTRKRSTVPAKARTVSHTPAARASDEPGRAPRPPRGGAARRPERTSLTTLRERVVEEATTAGDGGVSPDGGSAGGES
jgi:hypothetical protein